jgi:hypothetical protein
MMLPSYCFIQKARLASPNEFKYSCTYYIDASKNTYTNKICDNSHMSFGKSSNPKCMYSTTFIYIYIYIYIYI